ncbi:transketolase C-terminal domain-containing protein [Lawsonella clevelandensis]|jgi:putative pyruvate ferredoxin oxidoreductase subunit alpha|uniref:transketolase C-terminal domain-containing protein n=1 Tax=Lawsonella clevelandensis TaxID=1528099 RepID=UPI0026F0B9C4|nr:transketolase C-terminal domain-containing protein [Lawsonella clevelandensis]
MPVLKQIEGSQAMAQAVAACKPQVVAAYPISPQTHIVEALSKLVKDGELQDCEYLNVESEYAAMSASIGASAVGARAYTATASQGLLFMVEAVYNASGLGLPIVMTVANRAIGAPINIWNDHTDAMSQRDSGWLQLYAETNQEAADLHVQAFRIAEELSLPVMVCMDGFILTHAVEQVDVPEEEQVAKFLPPYEPRQVLDPEHPMSIGAMVGPEAFTEVRYLAHHKQKQARELIPQVQKEFEKIFGRQSGGLIHTYHCDDADTIIVALGSVVGTLKDVVDERRAQGEKIGVLSICSFRPFPFEAVGNALKNAKTIISFEKAFQVGIGGIVSSHIFHSLRDIDPDLHPDLYEVIAGLGGRNITKHSIHDMLDSAQKNELEPLTFLDLDRTLVEAELERQETVRRSGPMAENMLRDVNTRANQAANARNN